MKINVNADILLETPSLEYSQEMYTLVMSDKEELETILSFVNDQYTVQDEIDFIKSLKEDSHMFNIFYQNNLCGKIGLFDYNIEDHSFSIYYYVSSRYRRKQIAEQSVQALLNYAFNNLNTNKINFYINELNTPSLKLVSKLNGEDLGLLKDNDFVNGKYYHQHHFVIEKLNF